MMRRGKSWGGPLVAPVVVAAMSICGCNSDAKLVMELQEQNRRLQIHEIELEETIGKRETKIAVLEQRLKRLEEKGIAPREALFPIERIEILDITGGVDLDGNRGDDGVAVYFRPVDRDGDVLKRGGEIHIKLLDNATIGAPRVMGEAIINDPEQIRKLWYGKFWTNHYKVVVRFAPNVTVPSAGELEVTVRFLDRTTGYEYTARTAVEAHGAFRE
jgi:hypothetical protein